MAPSRTYHSATVLLNTSSGSGQDLNIRTWFAELSTRSQVEYKVVSLVKDRRMTAQCEELVKQAKARNEPVIAAGGDGTVSLIASLCYKHGVTLGVIPLGTFNYFARDLKISTTAREAIEALPSYTAKSVAVGVVNGHVFLNNASLGIYTRIIRERERHTSQFGRIRWIAALSAVKCLLSAHTPLQLKLLTNQEAKPRPTSMLFVGNNRLQLENLGLGSTQCAEHDRLAVIFMPPVSKWRTLVLLFQGISGTLKSASALEEFCTESFEVETQKRRVQLALDGELIYLKSPLHFSVEREKLHVLLPIDKDEI